MIRSVFPTLLYEADIGAGLLIERLARDDKAGIRWSRDKGYAGYTSYASLDDLTRRDPAFAELAKTLTRHGARFIEECGFELGRRPRLDSLWVNLLKASGHHSGHIHPHSVISGTFYVEVPAGAGGIRFEDPRLPLMMAAPQRESAFVTIDPRPGLLLLWESWLRHEVLPGHGRGDRLSTSFNLS